MHTDPELLRGPGVLQLRKNFRFVTLPFGGRAQFPKRLILVTGQMIDRLIEL